MVVTEDDKIQKMNDDPHLIITQLMKERKRRKEAKGKRVRKNDRR